MADNKHRVCPIENVCNSAYVSADMSVCPQFPVALIAALLKKGSFTMQALRPEIQAFIRASETLLSPASLGTPLTNEERELIAYYAQTVAQEFASLLQFGGLS